MEALIYTGLFIAVACALAVLVIAVRNSAGERKGQPGSAWQLPASPQGPGRTAGSIRRDSLKPDKQSARKKAKLEAPLPPEVSPYGRIPLSTFELLSWHVRDVTGPVLAYLPLTVTKEMRDWTVHKTLECVLRDWSENGNAEALSPADVTDLGSFAELAYNVCSPGRPETSLQELAVYKAVLAALLEDWLQNWNADGGDGPP